MALYNSGSQPGPCPRIPSNRQRQDDFDDSKKDVIRPRPRHGGEDDEGVNDAQRNIENTIESGRQDQREEHHEAGNGHHG